MSRYRRPLPTDFAPRAGRAVALRVASLLLLLLAVACSQPATPEAAPRATATVASAATATFPAPTATRPPPTATPAPPTATLEGAVADVLEDVPYALASAPSAADQLLDVYVPAAPGDYPVVLWAHGTDQDKVSGRIFGRLLAREGYVVVVINWLDRAIAAGDFAAWREMMENADCALRFIRAETGQYGADPSRLIWTGFSAGGWLGSLAAFGAGDLQGHWDAFAAARGGPEPQVSCAAAAEPASIVAYVASSTPFDADFWTGEATAAADADDPIQALAGYTAIGNNPDLKVRLIQGRADGLAPLEEAEQFAQALTAAGYDVALLPQDGGHEAYFPEAIAQILLLAAVE